MRRQCATVSFSFLLYSDSLNLLLSLSVLSLLVRKKKDEHLFPNKQGSKINSTSPTVFLFLDVFPIFYGTQKHVHDGWSLRKRELPFSNQVETTTYH